MYTLDLQIEVMKGNVKSRLQIYYQELEKFKARCLYLLDF